MSLFAYIFENRIKIKPVIKYYILINQKSGNSPFRLWMLSVFLEGERIIEPNTEVKALWFLV